MKFDDEKRVTCELSTDEPKSDVQDNSNSNDRKEDASPDDNPNDVQCPDEGIDVNMCEDLSTQKNEVKLIFFHYLY